MKPNGLQSIVKWTPTMKENVKRPWCFDLYAINV